MPNNLGHDKIPLWTQDIWDAIGKAVESEHHRTAVAAQFLGPPVLDDTMNGTVAADTVFAGEDGVLSVDESENRSIVEIAVQFRVREAQVDNEAKMKTAESLATRAANLLARGEDLLIFQGLAGLQDPLFKAIRLYCSIQSMEPAPSTRLFSLTTNRRFRSSRSSPIRTLRLTSMAIIRMPLLQRATPCYRSIITARWPLCFRRLQFADTYATRSTTLDIPAITADRLKGLIGDFYGTGTLPALSNSSPAKGVLIARDGNTTDFVVQMAPTVAVVTQDSASGDFVFKVCERFALRLKDPLAVVELDFVAGKTTPRQSNRRRRANMPGRRIALAACLEVAMTA